MHTRTDARTSAVAARDVPALDHEPGDDPVESRPFEGGYRVLLAPHAAQYTKVLRSQWRHFVKQLDLQSADRLACGRAHTHTPQP